ncbi:MAG: glycoside hydrolase family 3 protein, partial [Planctomycetota bacterium]
RERNELQKIAVEGSRLGIPLMFGFDVIHGYRTIFPIPLGLAATWEPALVEKAAAIGASEASSAGVDWTFAPMVDIARDGRWGRIAEGFGEDPYLASVFSAAAVRGFQGTDPSSPSRLMACLKHYVGYGAAEGGRDYNTCELSERTLREVYLPPFKAGVDAGAGTVMSAFNDISGIPASANRQTLTDILRGEWKFDGFVVSDWNSINELINHGFAEDQSEAAGRAVTAGVDMDMVSQAYLKRLPELVRQGKVSEEFINEAVRRILKVKLRAGLFER